MDAPGSSNREQNEYLCFGKEAKKVRVYIDELRSRLAELQNEGDEIQKTTETILGEANDHSSNDDTVALNVSSLPEASPTTSNLIGAIVSQAAGFTSLLRKFENMQKDSETSARAKEEPEEIRLLREQNGNIRNKIRQIQSRIERAQKVNSFTGEKNPSAESLAEKETCTQLYEAATNTLKKVNALEKEIVSVESLVKDRKQGLPLEMVKDKKLKSTKY